jgi:menaquinone-9 beta-reductase
MTLHATVIIVGAGPAGAAAAYHLCRAGVDTCLLDRSEFPRDKICGDGLSTDALTELEKMGLAEKVTASLNPIRGCRLYSPNSHFFEVDEYPGRGGILARKKLDAWLLEKAIGAGASFHAGVHVETCAPQDDRVELCDRAGRVFSCQMVLIATGSNDLLPVRLGLQAQPAADAVARRAYFENVRCLSNQVQFSYAREILPGYGWIFPLGQGCANIGVGCFFQSGKKMDLMQVWNNFLAWLGKEGILGPQARMLGPAQSGLLRMGLRGNRLSGNRVLLLGDSAATINPLSGEGIAQALLTGRLAAEAARAAVAAGNFTGPFLQAYRQAVRRALAPAMLQFRLLRAGLHYPWLLNFMVGRAKKRNALARLLYGTIVGEIKPGQAMGKMLRQMLF